MRGEKRIKGNARIFLDQLKSFLIEYRIEILSIPEDPDLLFESVATYRLLPNDAAIVAACRYHGIKSIATFDSDFNRVGDLKVISYQ